jgi:hypothetical protein
MTELRDSIKGDTPSYWKRAWSFATKTPLEGTGEQMARDREFEACIAEGEQLGQLLDDAEKALVRVFWQRAWVLAHARGLAVARGTAMGEKP